MKARLCVVTLSIAVGVTLAQNPPAQETTQTPQTSTQTEAKAGTPAGSASATLPEMKTMTYKGVLVDLSCGSHKSGETAAAATTQPSDASKTAAAEQTNTANRSMSDSGSCPASATSSELGMKMDDGKTVRFDLVGNQRAQEALKNDKRWAKDLSANKPIRATASGVLNGDKLIVTSIH